MSKRSASLPSFKNPPISEVSIGLRFEPLQQLRIPHFGSLWQRVKDQYPVVEHATPLVTDLNVIVEISTGAPLPRVWFVSSDDTQLLQFQSERFYFNWRERGKAYPRYSHIIEKYESAKSEFDKFLDELKLGPLNPIEYELSYFNQIPRGKGWDSNEDLAKVFKDFHWNKGKRFLPSPDLTSWQNRFSLPGNRGTLTAKLTQGKRKDNETPVLVLELIAKGMAEDRTSAGVRAWYDNAHESIVRGFADLTTEDIQSSIWNRENDSAR